MNCTADLLQCDETRPQCHKCLDRDFKCHYNPSASHRASPKTASKLAIRPSDPMISVLCSQNETLAALIEHGLAGSCTATFACPRDLQSLRLSAVEKLHHFQTATCSTLSVPVTENIYQNELVRTAIGVSTCRRFSE